MLFTEPTFLFLFLPVLLALYFVTFSRSHGSYGNWLLLVASVLFYAKGGRGFTWLMLGSIAFNYRMAILIARRQPDARPAGAASGALPLPAARAASSLLVFTVAVNLVVLGVFKYANFFADNATTLLLALHARPLVVPRVLLPIGISFFTFHAISYVVDVYRGDATAQKSPVHAALYLLLFPQLIAGSDHPLPRHRRPARRPAGVGRRFRLGDSPVRHRAGQEGAGGECRRRTGGSDFRSAPRIELDPARAWLGIVCYTLQIYFDFSGYSDMAIGLGRMFGFRFPENFRWPYIAETVQGFWRRWHMSLSTWFRDYLYVPLGGNRHSAARVYVNLVIVFFLCGLWHGASWNFVIWGLFHGAFLVVERLGLAGRVMRLWRPLRHAYVLLVVMIGWVFFRADTLPAAIGFLKAMGGTAGEHARHLHARLVPDAGACRSRSWPA